MGYVTFLWTMYLCLCFFITIYPFLLITIFSKSCQLVGHMHIETHENYLSRRGGTNYNILIISITKQTQTYVLFFMPCVCCLQSGEISTGLHIGAKHSMAY